MKIGPEIPAGVRAFIPVQTEPAQPIVNRLRRDFGVPGPVCVLDAQDERAAGMFGVEPIEKRGARAADVEVTGGRWRKSDANGRAHETFSLSLHKEFSGATAGVTIARQIRFRGCGVPVASVCAMV